jgi:hypothetical protein
MENPFLAEKMAASVELGSRRPFSIHFAKAFGSVGKHCFRPGTDSFGLQLDSMW